MTMEERACKRQHGPPHRSLKAKLPKRTRTVAGRFGAYGGRYVPETLMAALQELEAAYAVARKGQIFSRRVSPLAG